MSQKSSERRSLGRRIQGVTMPIRHKRMKWGRNWQCLCGSGKKYKNCCQKEIDELTASDGNADVEALSEDVQQMINDHVEAEKNKNKEKELKKNGGAKSDG